LSVSIKLNQRGIDKIKKQIENEFNHQIQIGVSSLKKDSEKFLEITLRKREETREDAISCNINEFNEIPNVYINIKAILEDLKIHGCVSNSSKIYIGGDMIIYLTMEGIEYFKNKVEKEKEVEMKNNTNNFYGSVSNMQIQQGTINSNQTQTVSTSENIDFDKVSEFIEKIRKYDAHLDNEYGEQATEIRTILEEIRTLIQNKENPEKIKSLLIEMKKLSVNVTESIIATGIVEGIKNLLI